jgi:hypothetical protein
MDEQKYLLQNANAVTKVIPGLQDDVKEYEAPVFEQYKRDWNPKVLHKNELPEYLKRDPVLWRFFARLNYEDKNFLALVVGDTGTGKSCSAISLARAVDITPLGGGRFKHNFNITSDKSGRGAPDCRVVFGPSDFLKLIKSGLPRGSIIVWDEAGVGNDATKWQDKRSQLIKHIMQTFRSRNYGVFLTVPDKESITLATRRLVHCYVEMTARATNNATARVTWAQRSRSREKTETFYKYPVYVDPETGKYKKILSYKIPRLDRQVESQYNKIKDTTLQNLYEFYQREMDFIDKELGLKEDEQNKIATKPIKFNMSKCLENCKSNLKELRDNDGDWSEAKVMLLLSKKNYDCNKAQAKLLIELLGG